MSAKQATAWLVYRAKPHKITVRSGYDAASGRIHRAARGLTLLPGDMDGIGEAPPMRAKPHGSPPADLVARMAKDAPPNAVRRHRRTKNLLMPRPDDSIIGWF